MNSIDHYIPFTNNDDFSHHNEWEIVNGPVNIVITVLPEPFPINVSSSWTVLSGSLTRLHLLNKHVLMNKNRFLHKKKLNYFFVRGRDLHNGQTLRAIFGTH